MRSTDLPGQTLELAKARFNRRCRWCALGYLAIVLPLSLHFRPTEQDLSGLYVGAMVARQGNWDALYPNPSADRRLYIGEKGQGQQKPALLEMARERRIGRSQSLSQSSLAGGAVGAHGVADVCASAVGGAGAQYLLRLVRGGGGGTGF